MRSWEPIDNVVLSSFTERIIRLCRCTLPASEQREPFLRSLPATQGAGQVWLHPEVVLLHRQQRSVRSKAPASGTSDTVQRPSDRSFCFSSWSDVAEPLVENHWEDSPRRSAAPPSPLATGERQTLRVLGCPDVVAEHVEHTQVHLGEFENCVNLSGVQFKRRSSSTADSKFHLLLFWWRRSSRSHIIFWKVQRVTRLVRNECHFLGVTDWTQKRFAQYSGYRDAPVKRPHGEVKGHTKEFSGSHV